MKKKDSFTQIKYGAIASYVLIFINIILGLIYTPWILREIGSSDYGLYTLASSLMAMFLLDFGMGAAVTRYIALYRAQNEQRKAEQFLGLIYKVYLFITLIILAIFVCLYFFLGVIYQNLTTEEIERFRIVYLIVGTTLVVCFPFNTLNGILSAYEEFVVLKTTDLISKLAVVVITIVALVFHGGLYALVLVNSAITIITVFVKLYLVYRCTGIKTDFAYYDGKLLKEIFGFSVWNTFKSMGQSMVYNIVPSILAIVSSTTMVTMFGFANVIEGYVCSICSAVDGLFLTRVSKIVVTEKDSNAILPLMIKVGRLSQSIISLLFLGILIYGKTFIHLWLGQEYEPVYYCIVILCISYLVSTSQQIGNNAILAMNYIKYQSMITIATGLINIVMTFLLARQFGVVGAAVSILIIEFIRIIGNNVIYVRLMHMNIRSFFKECHMKLLPGCIFSFIIAIMTNFILKHIFIQESWLYLCVAGVILCLEYLVIMWMIAWNKEEKALYLSVFKSLIKHG